MEPITEPRTLQSVGEELMQARFKPDYVIERGVVRELHIYVAALQILSCINKVKALVGKDFKVDCNPASQWIVVKKK